MTSSVAIALVLTGLSARADESSDGLEEIVVTAQKRSQNINDVPIAISAITGKKMEELGLEKIDDLANYVPGLQVQLQSPNNPGWVVRGITSDSGSAQEDMRVSVFVDGVPNSRSRGSVVELFDIDRVEVLKGPQGTLFGRGAEIGAIHIITSKPELGVLAGNARVEAGNYSQQEYEAAINIPVDDKVAVRLAGISRDRDGYVKNLAGGSLDGAGVKAARGSVLVEPTDRLSLTTEVNYQHDHYSGTSFKNAVYAPPGGDTSAFDAADLNRGSDLGIRRDLFNVTLTGAYKIDDGLTLNSISGFRRYNAHEEFDADGSQAYLLEAAEIAKGHQWSQEFRLNYDDGDRFQGFTGVSYFHENNSQAVPLSTDEQQLVLVPAVKSLLLSQLPARSAAMLKAYLNAFGPPILANGAVNPGVPALPGLLSLRSRGAGQYIDYGDNTAYDIFTDGTYAITPELSLTVGLRFTHEDQRSAFVETVDKAGSLTSLILPSVPYTQRSQEFDSAVGRVVASYKLDQDAMAYASISRGRRPAVVQITATENDTLKNEVVWSYETGVKADLLDRRLHADAAFYYYQYSNFQSSVQDTNSLLTVTRDSGSASAYGFETSLTAQATSWMQLFANYGYIDARFDQRDENGNRQAYAGYTFRLTPKHTLAVGANLEQPLEDRGLVAFLTPSFTWKSRVYFEDANSSALSQSPYGLLNARLGLRSVDQGWSVALYGQNLLNRHYLIDAGNTGETIGLPTYIAGTPRLFGAQASVKF